MGYRMLRLEHFGVGVWHLFAFLTRAIAFKPANRGSTDQDDRIWMGS